jgi:type II secretory pathway pseudopilin PulG
MHALRHRLAAQDGFTMIVTMLVLLVLLGLGAATYVSVAGDLRPSRRTDEQKRARAAADAGLAWYQAKLQQDPSLLTSCTDLDPKWNGTLPDPRTWRRVHAANPNNLSEFTIEALLPCDPNNEGAMLDANGLVRLRISGRARAGTATDRAPKASIIATFRRKGFLDYLYLSDLETLDPPLQGIAYGVPNTSGPDMPSWAAANCLTHWTAGRSLNRYPGNFTYGSNTQPLLDPGGDQVPCAELKWTSADTVAGPFHTNDSILVCGAPTFGANATDVVEISATGAQSVRDAATENPDWWGCADPFTDPRTTGVSLMRTGVAPLELPSWDPDRAIGALKYTGKTTITFLPTGSMQVDNASLPGGTETIAQPNDQVIYVENGGGGCPLYSPVNPDATPASCGEARIRGTYTANMTIFAMSDIVVTGNLVKGSFNGSDPILGLIADNYVRVAHSVGGAAVYDPDNGACTSTATASTAPATQLTIEAAILALKHSFLVDNWRCRFSPAGQHQLTVIGAIAQKHRGPTGSGTQAGGSGYWKDYRYDRRLKFRSPPKFLDPLQSGWRLMRVTDQLPAT